ncbi:hypothetical protein [Haloglomus salinum]|jgi:hypothetical protein|uniref:hypothetical protein n=1 Tax=Haloglomus salinum TaxID=2962673 RepID=UPI0020C988CA|nr:hypothetical protein [Haloglomus salinum]
MAFDLGFTLPFCDTPEQSAVIGVGSGLVGGGVGLAAGLDATGVVVLAGTLAFAGEMAGHAEAGDFQRWFGSERDTE